MPRVRQVLVPQLGPNGRCRHRAERKGARHGAGHRAREGQSGRAWRFSGGRGAPVEGLVREVREELGVGVEVEGSPVLLATHTYGPDGPWVLAMGFRVRIVDGEPQPADDVAELRWVSADEVDGAGLRLGARPQVRAGGVGQRELGGVHGRDRRLVGGVAARGGWGWRHPARSACCSVCGTRATPTTSPP